MKTLNAYIQQKMDKYFIPGAALGIDMEGERIYDETFGYRHVNKKLPVTADTVFGIASMTKSFTCVAIMQLQEAGKLFVHDSVKNYLPNFKTPYPVYTNDITIHHLMTHTSGLPPLKTHVLARKRSIDKDPSAKDYGLDVTANDGEPIDTYADLIDYLANEKYEMLGKPGRTYSYSNDAYGLLGAIIEAVSGKSYEQYITDHILEPCQMTRSFILLDDLQTFANDLTELYVAREDGDETIVYEAPVWWDAPAMRAAGYIKSTVNDILKYLNSFYEKDSENAILSEESISKMFYPHVKYEPGKFYGYGFRITPNGPKGMTLIDHGGGLKAVSSMMCLIPEKELSGVVLTNLSGVPAGDLLLGSVKHTFGLSISDSFRQFKDQPIEKTTLERFTGTYASDEGMKVTFFMSNDQLMIQSGLKAEPLRYIGNNMFMQPNSDRIIQFLKNKNGCIDRVFYQSRHIFKKD